MTLTADTSTSPVLPGTRFTARDYATAKQMLSDYIKRTYPDVWTDYYDATLGSVLVDLLSLTIDTTSWTVDASVLETFLSTCRRYDSALFAAKSAGYTPKGAIPAIATIKSSTALPANLVNNGCVVRAGSRVTGSNGYTYEVLTDAIFPPGTNTLRVPVYEGQTVTETFTPVNTPNITYTTQQANVADKSWYVYVGDSTNPANLWTQVANVFLQSPSDQAYDISWDNESRLIVRFGDGTSGAVPLQSVTVIYRTCHGSAGNTAANTITGTVTVYDQTALASGSPVTFANVDAFNSGVSGTQTVSREIVGSLSNSAIQSGSLSQSSLVAGTLVLDLALPNGTPISLYGNADGTFTQDPSSYLLPNATRADTAVVEIGTNGTGAAYAYTTTCAAVSPNSWDVYVNGILWTQVSSLAGQGAVAPVYTATLSAGQVTFSFGDGFATGAAVPTGIAPTFAFASTAGTSRAQYNTGAFTVILGTVTTQTATAPGTGGWTLTTANPSVLASAVVTVGGTPWVQVTSLGLYGGSAQVYTVTQLPGGALTLTFGNGTNGAIPSGTTIVTYTASAIIPASGGSIAAAYNYTPTIDPTNITVIGAATGGADKESVDQLRVNVPAFQRTADRVITTQDYVSALAGYPGVARAGVQVVGSSATYSSNVVNLFLWSSQDVAFQSSSSDGSTNVSNYTQYSVASTTLANSVLQYLSTRSVVTTHNAIITPGIAWVDMYLGRVRYDSRYSAQTIRQNITDAIIAYVQSASGYEFRLSDVVAAAQSVTGVGSLNPVRVSVGYKSAAETAQVCGATNGTASVFIQIPLSAAYDSSGNLTSRGILQPGTATLYVTTPAGVVTLKDTGTSAGFSVVASPVSLATGQSYTVSANTIDYAAGSVALTFNQPVSPGAVPITCSFSDIVYDYRLRSQGLNNNQQTGDAWPPPSTTQSYPSQTGGGLPWTDGYPAQEAGSAWSPITATTQTTTSPGVATPGWTLTSSYHAAPTGQVVTVNGTTWTRIGSFATALPTDNVYTVTLNTNGTITITFGNGTNGALIPLSATVALTYLQTPAAPTAGTEFVYPPMQDIVVQTILSLGHFFDNSFLFNSAIQYNSSSVLTSDIRVINLRKLHFDLVPL